MQNNRTDLVEIKKGKTGTGLLIEEDGYISINETEHNRQLKESIEKLQAEYERRWS